MLLCSSVYSFRAIFHTKKCGIMYGRRVFACGPLPRRMYPTLHIGSVRQANRCFPSLVPVSSLLASTSSLSSAKSSFLALSQGVEISAPSSSSILSSLMEDASVLLERLSASQVFSPVYGFPSVRQLHMTCCSRALSTFSRKK